MIGGQENRRSEQTRESADAILARLERKYFWWQTPKRSRRPARRVLAQVMNIGDFDDVQDAVQALGLDPFADVLRAAEPGWLNRRSWAYWHYRCNVTSPALEPPPMPRRRAR